MILDDFQLAGDNWGIVDSIAVEPGMIPGVCHYENSPYVPMDP